MLKSVAAALSAVLLVAACEPTTQAADTGADPLAGTWRIASIGGTKTENPMGTFLTFTGLTTVTGSFGCDQFTANYTYDRNTVLITNVTPGTSACSGAAERQDRHGRRLITFPATVVADAQAAILSGREGQSFALHR